MKAKVTRGDGFRGCLEYVLGKEIAECLGGTVVGTDAGEMARTFRAAEQGRRKEVKKAVWHSSLTLPAGESLSADKWLDVASSYMDKMGMSDNRAYSVVRHSDTEHDHVHIIASRVGLDASLWSNSQDVYKAIAATQAIEKEYSLTKTKGYEGKNERKSLSYKEMNQAKRTGEIATREYLQKKIGVSKATNYQEFAAELKKDGISVKSNTSGDSLGISFSYNGIAYKGSQLGTGYSGASLLQRRQEEQRLERQEEEQKRVNVPEEKELIIIDSQEEASKQYAHAKKTNQELPDLMIIPDIKNITPFDTKKYTGILVYHPEGKKIIAKMAALGCEREKITDLCHSEEKEEEQKRVNVPEEKELIIIDSQEEASKQYAHAKKTNQELPDLMIIPDIKNITPFDTKKYTGILVYHPEGKKIIAELEEQGCNPQKITDITEEKKEKEREQDDYEIE